MRYFSDLEQALFEIKRDLAKSPEVNSPRVQGKPMDGSAYEAMNYSYTIDSSGIPDLEGLLSLGSKFFPMWRENREKVAEWMFHEHIKRFSPLSSESLLTVESEFLHPELQNHTEGNHFGYTYRERMVGLVPTITNTLLMNRETRRAYWPIFQPLDSHRAHSMTRIPCTIGYHFMIRDVAMLGERLTVTNLQRSADFNKFFLSDLWMTHQLQAIMCQELEVEPGVITHHILSFHMFTGEEIY